MMNSYWNGYAGAFIPGMVAGWASMFIVPLAIWSVFWMGMALWKAARNDSKVWFIVLLLVHTFGILDILYVFLFSKESKSRSSKKH